MAHDEIVYLKNRHGRTVEVSADHADKLLKAGGYTRAQPPAEPSAEQAAEPTDKKPADKKPR